eukprot:251600_1
MATTLERSITPLETSNHNYISMDVDLNDACNVILKTLSKQFKWLNRLILYFPMWCTNYSPNIHRSKMLNAVVIFISISAVLAATSMDFYKYINSFSKFQMVTAYYNVELLLLLITRFTSIYYFYKYFNFPWKIDQITFAVKINDISVYQNTIKKNRVRIQLYICSVFVLDIISLVYSAYKMPLVISNNDIVWTEILLLRIFGVYPNVLTVSILSVIFLKHKLYLMCLMEKLNNDNIEFQSMFDEYEQLLKNLKHEYNNSLQYFIQLFLAALLCDIWVSTADLISTSMADLGSVFSVLTDVVLLVEVSLGASILTETFEKFYDKLSEYGKYHKLDRYDEYNYLLHFVSKYRMDVKIAGQKISRSNAMRFVVVFSIAKWASYSIHSLYD